MTRYQITMTVDIEEVSEKASTKKPPKEPKRISIPMEAAAPRVAPFKPMVYGVKDAAMMLGISRSSIYLLLKEGHLTPVKIGRRLLFLEAELQALLEKNRGR